MAKILSLCLSFLFFLAYSAPPKEGAPLTSDQLKAKANELAKKFIITDGHIDLPYRLKAGNFDITKDKDLIISTEKGDFDYERSKAGGLDAPFMSIYIPARYQQSGGAKELADTLINLVCDSSYDTTRTWNGLSPFGREVVQEMNRVGIMVDVSSDTGIKFIDLADEIEELIGVKVDIVSKNWIKSKYLETIEPGLIYV